MEPLDLSKRPPRGPRAKIGGAAFVARTVDKMRAALPGGNLGPYNDGHRGMSTLVLKTLGIDPAELQAVVARAASEDEIADWLRERAGAAQIATANELVQTASVKDMDEDRRKTFEANYPHHREVPSGLLADILDADDAALFPGRLG